MIFFIAAIVVATAITGVLITTTYKFSDSIEQRGGDIGDSIGTDINIANDEIAMPYNASNNTLTLYIQNTGSTMIPFDNATVIVMINGTYYDNLTFVLPSGVTQWGPNIMMTIVVGDVTLPDADYRLMVVVASGAKDTITFRIG
jgi:flagellar protein FlaG